MQTIYKTRAKNLFPAGVALSVPVKVHPSQSVTEEGGFVLYDGRFTPELKESCRKAGINWKIGYLVSFEFSHPDKREKESDFMAVMFSAEEASLIIKRQTGDRFARITSIVQGYVFSERDW